MRILMSSTADAGHLRPMLPFARALVEAGHEVQAAAPRSAAPLLEGAGLRLWSCDDVAPEVLATFHEAIARDPARMREIMVRDVWADAAARAFLPGVLAAIDIWQPDVVLRDTLEFASAVAADMRSVPHVQMLHGRAGILLDVRDEAAGALTRLRRFVGLPADPEGRALRTPCLTRLPEFLDEPYTAGPAEIHRFRGTGGEVAGEPLPAWWANPRGPLVYVTFGTVLMRRPEQRARLRALVEAVGDLPVRLLVTYGGNPDDEAWPTLPPNAHVVDWVDQERVLREAAAVVHHGGMGNVLETLSAGVPSVVVPHGGDAPGNAARVVEAGAGLSVDPAGEVPFDPADVRAALARVLSEPAFAAAARRAAGLIESLPAIEKAVTVFEDARRA
ncbi:glycosyltransferase [Streptomyces fuscigenes]|uniref:glycosyltransferase n=1 Tax=Streptomyces fuscigenes TaxID=1528880 RepID=UPI001F25A322|nr:glycosyltransferase [Streptomyces fuscigenes]MCF3961458.1 glycosyltransferase [Streptomyces fuscigenes]